VLWIVDIFMEYDIDVEIVLEEYIDDPSPLQGFSMLGSQVLASWREINASILKIIGLGVRFGVSPLGTSGHANGVPSRDINPQTIKEITSSRHRYLPRKLKTPRPKERGLPNSNII
jgi:hypothetical protein